MERKSFSEQLSTVTAQLITWVPIALLLLRIRSNEKDTKLLVTCLALAVTGIIWFAFQIRDASREADEKGVLRRPEAFWSLVTGKVSSRVRDLNANRELFVVGGAGVAPVADLFVPKRERPDNAPISFFTIQKADGTAKEREAEIGDLRHRLESRHPVAVILIDDGDWAQLRDYEASIRDWGATHSELPILAVQTDRIRGGGLNPSLAFSAVELRRIARAPVAGLADRLLQQSALRGELWRKTATNTRYIALAGIACTMLFGAIAVGFIMLVRSEQERSETAARASLLYQQALLYPNANQLAALKTAQEYRRNPAAGAAAMLQAANEALRTAIFTAHPRRGDDANVVFLAAEAVGDSVQIVEVARSPVDNFVRVPFSYRASSDRLYGIGTCAVATRHAVYWRGVNQPGRFETDSIAAWETSGTAAGSYDAGDHVLRVAGRSCEYKRLPGTIADNDRNELLCVPVGTTSNSELEPLGAICVSSDEDSPWVVEPWVRDAIRTAGIWLAPIDWQSAARAKGGGSPSPPPASTAPVGPT
ncbi:MAG TPA: hypothetical protein VJT67_09355 [Longimicrobiaceae bacterium]|nr:hypothetical protein [Longimicrobiaceae bacterium]